MEISLARASDMQFCCFCSSSNWQQFFKFSCRSCIISNCLINALPSSIKLLKPRMKFCKFGPLLRYACCSSLGLYSDSTVFPSSCFCKILVVKDSHSCFSCATLAT